MSAGLPHSKLQCHCGKTALYRVGFKGFCKDHYADGEKAQSKRIDKQKAWAITNKPPNLTMGLK